MGRVQDKVCIVTGAASGMGLSHAQVLAGEGAKVVLTDLNKAAGEKAAQDIGDNAVFVEHNVAELESWKSLIDFVKNTYGRIDVLVNNAGILRIQDFADTTVEDWDLLHAVNSRGAFIGCQQVLPIMEAQGGGSIINVSSISANQGMTITIAYGASKGSVSALTKGLAVLCRDNQKGVRCNAIYPDGVKTPMITGNANASKEEIEAVANLSELAKMRMCEAVEISNTVLFLASDEAPFINGAEIHIDGGSTVTPPPTF